VPAHLTVTDGASLRHLERLARSLVAREGEVWMWANAARYRKLRQLAARFRCEPIPGGDMLFNGPPPMPPHSGARPGETIPDAGGLLVLSAHPFPETD
jgi:hypothetical protein